MRRQITPRATMSQMFASLKRILKKTLEDHIPSEKRDSFSLTLEEIDRIRDFCVTSAQEAPPFNQDDMVRMIAQNDASRLSSFVRRHLENEIRILSIDGVSVEALTDSLMDGLCRPGDLDEIARAAVAAHPKMKDPEFNAYLVEEILREAVGLDGRVPETRFSEDLAAYHVMSLRMALQAASPEHAEAGFPGPVEDHSSPASYDHDRVSALLSEAGLPEIGFSRDMAFHVAAGNIARDAVARIELLMGGGVPAETQYLLAMAIERAANITGPQLTITMESDVTP